MRMMKQLSALLCAAVMVAAPGQLAAQANSGGDSLCELWKRAGQSFCLGAYSLPSVPSPATLPTRWATGIRRF